MGAQTRQSLDHATRLLAGRTLTIELQGSLFSAALALSGSKSLRQALTDSSADQASKDALAKTAFASLSTDAKKLMGELVGLPWSKPEDLQGALENLGIRVGATVAAGDDVVGELLAVSRMVHSDAELELALGSKRAAPAAKARLVASLLSKKVSAATLAIVSHLVSDSRGRRIGAMLSQAAEIVADQADMGLAVVSVAKPLKPAQKQSIQAMVQKRYGRDHYVAEVINPEIVGGAKIRVGSDVIDGSILTRLVHLRTQLAS